MNKKLLCVILTVIILLSMTACKNDEIEPTISPVGEIAEFEVDAYLVEEWKETNENSNSSSYHKTILVYTNGYYSEIENSDIKYDNGSETQPLLDTIDNAEINIININSINKIGTCAYVYIKTNNLIDMKKVKILVEGPAEYGVDTLTKEDYKNKYGNTDGWYAMLTTISNKTPPLQDIELTYNGDNYGFIRLFDKGRNQYWYEIIPELKTTNSTIALQIDVSPLKNTTREDFVREFINGCYPAKLENEQYKEVLLDKNLRIDGWIENDVVYIGFSTIDGSDITTYINSLPSIIYNNNYLVHVFNFSIS